MSIEGAGVMGRWRGPPHSEIPRCGAHAKGSGQPCRQYAMPNGRCRWHGGKSTGAKNPHRPLKHGRRTKAAEAERRAYAALLREVREVLKSMEIDGSG